MKFITLTMLYYESRQICGGKYKEPLVQFWYDLEETKRCWICFSLLAIEHRMTAEAGNPSEVALNYIMRCGLEFKRQSEAANGEPDVILLPMPTCQIEKEALKSFIQAVRHDGGNVLIRTNAN